MHLFDDCHLWDCKDGTQGPTHVREALSHRGISLRPKDSLRIVIVHILNQS